MRRSDFSITSFLKRSNTQASWQVITTLLPIAGLWCSIERINQTSLPVIPKIFAFLPILVLLTLFSSRAFSLMHDCGHGSLFRWRWLNRSIGFLLGVLNAIPQHPWSLDHAFHHRHNGDWEIYRGPVDVMKLSVYQDLSEQNKLFYAISRHWVMLFPGGFYYLVIKPRLALIHSLINFLWSISVEFLFGLRNRKVSKLFSFSTRFKLSSSGYGDSFWEVADLIGNNLLVIISWILMSQWLGIGLFFTCYSLIMTFSAAIFICLFFVQHNFKGSYANSTENWSQFIGALEGSSNLDLPNWMNWFFADISFHSMHHLCDRIPNYNLRACHLHNQHLLQNVATLRLEDIHKCFDYILWDDKLQELTTIDTAKKLKHLAV